MSSTTKARAAALSSTPLGGGLVFSPGHPALRCLEHIWQRFRFRARLFLLEGDDLVLRAWVGTYECCLHPGMKVDPASILWKVFRGGKPVNLTAPVSQEDTCHTLPKPVAIKAILPLHATAMVAQEGQPLGLLVVDTGDAARPIPERDFQYLVLAGMLLSEILARTLMMERFREIQRQKEAITREVTHICRNRFTIIGGAARRLRKSLSDPLLRRWAEVIIAEVSTGEQALVSWKEASAKGEAIMEKEDVKRVTGVPGGTTVLLAVDFSDCCRLALRRAWALLPQRPERLVALHVIDGDFIHECLRHQLGDEREIKRRLYLEAKKELRRFMAAIQVDGVEVETVVCEGVPFMEINKKALEYDASLIIMGSCGKTGDMETIFFGSTAEKVLRFITRPVLCVPPDADYRHGP